MTGNKLPMILVELPQYNVMVGKFMTDNQRLADRALQLARLGISVHLMPTGYSSPFVHLQTPGDLEMCRRNYPNLSQQDPFAVYLLHATKVL